MSGYRRGCIVSLATTGRPKVRSARRRRPCRAGPAMRSSGLGRDVRDAKRGVPPRANIYPARSPKHKYGIHVHESVVASGDPETGVWIHLVDAEYDRGPVIAQNCRAQQRHPATLQGRVLARENEFLVEMLKMIVAG
jgi:hypothetical protein